MMELLTQAQVTLPAADPLPLPAPPFIFYFLLFLTFALHMVAMNFTLGGTLVQAIAGFRENENLKKFSKFLSFFLPITMSFTVTLGIAPLLFIQVLYGQIFFTTSVLMGWIWFSVLIVLMIAYYGLYIYQFRHHDTPWVRRWLPVVTAVLLLVIALIFIMNFKLFYRAEEWSGIYASGQSQFFMNLDHPQVWPTFFHTLVSVMAFVGLLAILHGWTRKKEDPAYADWAIRFGGMLFIVHTAVQFAVGSWLLLSLPRELVKMFMFGNPLATGLLFTGMGLALVAILLALWARAKKAYGWPVVAVVTIAVLIVAVMTLVRAIVREYMLKGWFSIESLQIQPQWDTIIIFAVLLVAGLGTVAWMIFKVVTGKGEAAA